MKRWQKILVFTSIGLIALGLIYYFYLRSFRNQNNTNPPYSPPPTNQNPTPTPTTPTPTQPAQVIFYPISNYNRRLTFRWYGLHVTSAQKATPCGAPFTGYHVGDDLETFSNEKDMNTPVYAIANGTLREVNRVSGYGGLLILSINFNNQDYTVYYGHINLTSVSLKVGDTVKAGQFLANLGSECSIQTDGERKHLHFAIHKGASIDVRGYVPNTSELANWINPKAFLQDNNAKVPNQ